VRSDLLRASVLWALVTVGSWLVTFLFIAEFSFPTVGAEEAEEIDNAFLAMTYMAGPVFGLVVAVLVYSVWKFRGSGPDDVGATIHGEGSVPRIWFVVTTVFAIVVMIYPGLIGLASLRSDKTADLVIDVQARRWLWIATYEDSGALVVGQQELVLPIDQRVQFNITAVDDPLGDVLHSFWIPAFRTKIDVVPGQVTQLWVTPTQTGFAEDDSAFRIQCAELCGIGHAIMSMPVRVVEQEEFAAWHTALAAEQRLTPLEPAGEHQTSAIQVR
jgi:cytochrome c oxidase subunit 2